MFLNSTASTHGLIAGTLAAMRLNPYARTASIKRAIKREPMQDAASVRYRAGLENPSQFYAGRNEEEQAVRSWAYMNSPQRREAMSAYVQEACGSPRTKQAAMWPTVKSILERYSPEALGIPREMIEAAEWRGQRKTLGGLLSRWRQ